MTTLTVTQVPSSASIVELNPMEIDSVNGGAVTTVYAISRALGAAGKILLAGEVAFNVGYWMGKN